MRHSQCGVSFNNDETGASRLRGQNGTWGCLPASDKPSWDFDEARILAENHLGFILWMRIYMNIFKSFPGRVYTNAAKSFSVVDVRSPAYDYLPIMEDHAIQDAPGPTYAACIGFAYHCEHSWIRHTGSPRVMRLFMLEPGAPEHIRSLLLVAGHTRGPRDHIFS